MAKKGRPPIDEGLRDILRQENAGKTDRHLNNAHHEQTAYMHVLRDLSLDQFLEAVRTKSESLSSIDEGLAWLCQGLPSRKRKALFIEIGRLLHEHGEDAADNVVEYLIQERPGTMEGALVVKQYRARLAGKEEGLARDSAELAEWLWRALSAYLKKYSVEPEQVEDAFLKCWRLAGELREVIDAGLSLDDLKA